MTVPSPDIDYLIVGHVTADIGGNTRVIGGTASYAAKTAHAFGLRVGVLTSTQPDESLLAHLSPTAAIHNIHASHTTTFENVYIGDMRKQYVRHVAERLNADAIPDGWRNVPLLHVAPLVDEVDPGMVAAQFPNAVKLLTLQGLLRQWDDDGLVSYKRWFDGDALKRYDFIVFSEDDIAAEPDIEQEIVAVAPCVIVTRADRGGTVYRGGQVETYTTPQVEVVNPTGAGDVFASAFLSTIYLRNRHISQSLQVAARLAANCVTRQGLEGVPKAAEVQDLLSSSHN